MIAAATGDVVRIAWLIAAVLVASTPHFPFVSPWIIALVLGITTWRLLAEQRRWSLPSGWLRIPLTLIGFIAVIWTYRRISGVEAGTALLLAMVGLKLLETRAERDQAIVALICFFLLFAAFLREQAIWSVGILLLGMTFTICALLQASIHGRPFPPRRSLMHAVALMAQAIPLMLLLFFLFPRVPGPFWALPAGGGSGITGLSTTVSPGDISSLSRSDAVAFRVRFDSTVPEPRDRYWRGPVMSDFNGRSWSWRDRGLRPMAGTNTQGNAAAVHYELTLEPHGRRWLLALETAAQWDAPRGYLAGGYQLMNQSPIRQRIAYRAASILGGINRIDEQAQYLQANTYLPPASNPHSVAMAQRLRSAAADDRAYLLELLSMFRREPFFYTLSPQALGDNPVDQFLFDTREGFCEHYASAFAVLARAAGIPARLVTGYQGAERNPLANYWIVRQSNAHAWTEVWLDDAWVRFDPTAAVAPERIEYGLEEALPAGERNVIRGLRGNPMLNRLVLSWDAANAAWNQWVLGFGPETQRSLLQTLGFTKPSWSNLIAAMMAGCAVFLAGLAFLLGRAGIRPVDPVLRQYRRFCKRLANIGRGPQPAEGPSDFARAVIGVRPDLAGDVLAINALYLQLRYEGMAAADRLAEFTERIRRFRPSRRSV